MKIIPINKNNIPYFIDIDFRGIEYRMGFKYNSFSDTFTVDLYFLGDPIILGEPIVAGSLLFYDYPNLLIPPVSIAPLTTGDSINKIGWDNFGDTVNLFVFGDNDVAI